MTRAVMSRLKISHRRGEAGLSLIELMVAMVIGLFLLLGLVQVMGASRTAYELSTGVARTQENARFAMDFLQRDLRMAGHMGCVNDQAHMAPETPVASDATRQGLNLWFLTAAQRNSRTFTAAAFPLRFDMGVQGFDAQGSAPGNTLNIVAGTPVVGAANQWSPALPAEILALGPVAGSDIIVVRYLSADGVPAAVTAINANSYTAAPPMYGRAISTQDPSGLFGLADCKRASVFASNAIDNATGTVSMAVGGLNASGIIEESEASFIGNNNSTMLHRAESVVYFVGVGAGTNAAGNRPPALFRARAVNTGVGAITYRVEEVVEGVESLQLLYGMDENMPNAPPRGNMLRVREAAGVSVAANPGNADSDLWRRIGTVQVGLLLRSADPAAATQSNRVPTVLGVQMNRPGNDTFYRSVYESTITMRNRMFGN